MNQSVPTRVAGEIAFKTVSAGGTHTCGVSTTGAAYCWGYNNGHGQLGDGSTTTVTAWPTPNAVAGNLTFTSVSAGSTHTCGVTTSGAAYCWGYGYYGQLGTGDKNNRVAPAPIAGNLSFVSLDAGNSHTCGVTTSQVVYCWGQNGSGQLGDGSKTIRYEPLAVSP